MGALRLINALVALAASTPSNADNVTRWQPYIANASHRFGVPTDWIERVMRAESNGETVTNGRPIRSSAGAMGLMQLMPGTWDMMRQSLGLGTNPDDPLDNILAGTFYLKLMYFRFGYPALFAAYDAGPTRFAEHLATGNSLPSETIAYLKKVTAGRQLDPEHIAQPSTEVLFADQDRAEIVGPNTAVAQVSAELFAVRNDNR